VAAPIGRLGAGEVDAAVVRLDVVEAVGPWPLEDGRGHVHLPPARDGVHDPIDGVHAPDRPGDGLDLDGVAVWLCRLEHLGRDLLWDRVGEAVVVVGRGRDPPDILRQGHVLGKIRPLVGPWGLLGERVLHPAGEPGVDPPGREVEGVEEALPGVTLALANRALMTHLVHVPVVDMCPLPLRGLVGHARRHGQAGGLPQVLGGDHTAPAPLELGGRVKVGSCDRRDRRRRGGPRHRARGGQRSPKGHHDQGNPDLYDVQT
jgi:hypothetical protein